MIKRILNFFLLFFFFSLSLRADFAVIVKADKSKKFLLKDKTYLQKTFPKEKILIIPSKNRIWKYRLGIFNIKDLKKAKQIKEKLLFKYKDSYILDLKKSFPKIENLFSKNEKSKDEIININFSNLSLNDFVKLVSKITKKNILITKELKGKIDFIGSRPIKKSSLFGLLNQILRSNGYTLKTTKFGFLKVVKNSDAIKEAPAILQDNELDEMETKIIHLKRLKVFDVIKHARFLQSKYGKMTGDSSSNSIIITDFPENIEVIKDIIKNLESRESNEISYLNFKNVDVDSIYPKAKSMVVTFFAAFPKEKRVDLIKNEISNSLVLIGNRKSIRKIIPYLKKLDIKNSTVDKTVELVYIKNTEAKSVADLLNELISEKSFSENLKKGALKKKKNTPPIFNASKTAKISYSFKKDRPKITFDKQLNAVIIFASKREIKILKNIIKKLDVERKQVYVKAKILEISNEKASKIGVQYGIVGGISDAEGLYALSNKLGLENAGAGLDLAKNLNLSIPNAKKIIALGAALSLLRKEGAANVLSEPSVLCINNEESTIYVGETISVISQATVSTNTTDLNRNIYNREDVGLKLKIRPRISSDNKVALDVEIVLEDVVPGSPIGLPKTTKRVVKTSSIVKDGESVILGGLVREKRSKNESGIPILKDIPILGNIFKYNRIQKNKTTLVVLLTPYIVNKSEDLEKLKANLTKLYLFEQTFLKKISNTPSNFRKR